MRADLLSLKKSQLEQLVAGAALEVSGTKSVLVDALMAAWQKEAEEMDQQPAPTVDVEEKFCVDPRKLVKIIKSLEAKGDDVIELVVTEFEYREDILSNVMAKALSIGNHFQRLVIVPSDDFPHINFEKAKRPVGEIKGNILGMVSSIARTSGADIKAYHEKVFFDADNENIVSSDGDRMHLLKHDFTASVDLMLPGGAMKTLCKIASKENLKIYSDPDCSCVKFTFGNVAVLTKNDLDTNYPAYLDVVSSETGHTVTVEKKVLDRVLRQAVLMSDNLVKMTFNGGINFESQSETGVYHRENVPFVKGKVEPSMKMGMNPKFLVDAIRCLNDDVKIRLGDDKPIFLSSGKTFQACIMPVRTQ
jgi:DNA polymerase III sliding clamp (beta) subunit (PCNA family)